MSLLLNGYINPTIYSHRSSGKTSRESSMMWQEQLQRLKIAFLRIILTAYQLKPHIPIQKPARRNQNEYTEIVSRNMTTNKENSMTRLNLR